MQDYQDDDRNECRIIKMMTEMNAGWESGSDDESRRERLCMAHLPGPARSSSSENHEKKSSEKSSHKAQI